MQIYARHRLTRTRLSCSSLMFRKLITQQILEQIVIVIYKACTTYVLLINTTCAILTMHDNQKIAWEIVTLHS